MQSLNSFSLEIRRVIRSVSREAEGGKVQFTSVKGAMHLPWWVQKFNNAIYILNIGKRHENYTN